MRWASGLGFGGFSRLVFWEPLGCLRIMMGAIGDPTQDNVDGEYCDTKIPHRFRL